MHLQEALTQIDSIWAQVARTERFQGYRPATVASTGILGLIAALAQPWICPDPRADPNGFLLLWPGVAVVSVVLVALELLISYVSTDSSLDRQLTRRAAQQFLPCLIGGGVVTYVLPEVLPDSISLLPGLWAICFSLGVFASLPFITPTVLWVAGYYLLAGTLSLKYGRSELALHPWVMGGTFGIGQLLMAWVLWQSEERRHVTE